MCQLAVIRVLLGCLLNISSHFYFDSSPTDILLALSNFTCQLILLTLNPTHVTVSNDIVIRVSIHFAQAILKYHVHR